MGTVELDHIRSRMIIRSHIVTYGASADETITESIRHEIERMWNAPQAEQSFKRKKYRVEFVITASFHPGLRPEEVFGNDDPTRNYFRIEAMALGNISFVDGIGCNTGYFQRDNLYTGSTTAAHEYGHTIGLRHPHDIDFRGNGSPGIMYPRGTLVDANFQYNPAARAGDNTNGGTMHPQFRRVRAEDVDLLRLHRLDYNSDMAVLGEFSSVWHASHAEPGIDIAR